MEMRMKTLAWFRRMRHKRVYPEGNPLGVRILNAEHAQSLFDESVEKNIRYGRLKIQK